ncbi:MULTISPECIES: homoserine O-acetyltransferase [unclassified Leptolyngbya]|uniref:homoserine O-acetyltransferase MetX n=1 Tax=unclassified Leptolyngbya TaxID=2650499 RepID=UPI0016831C4C|nr:MULTISPECIES: homoserine O-acetyltransferase [unclassified Leptolyngbya]MBD1911119.1 homoserine O-acetyltransferase [Leptolyngbya sp. FACHB-8]MBD2154318.1 homoserine O-acetyltransferase [Leptolyngbya sp. FACHB-16]
MIYRHLLSPETQVHTIAEPVLLESGVSLPQVEVAYRTWGKLNASGDNAVLVCHALTGGADVDQWWAPLLGPGCCLDPEQDFVICSNILGSCYGTTGPTSIAPNTGQSYGPTFPAITVRDMVQVQARLIQGLGVRSLRMVIGGSLGGMQVLEWALLYPEMVQSLVPIATSGRHSAWCIGLSEAQRQAIYTDPNWQGGYYERDRPPAKGLAVARMMAMSMYRSWASFEDRFSRQLAQDVAEEPFAVIRYLHHHGDKLVNRFDANTYVTLTQAMDRHDVGRDRGDYAAVLNCIHQPTLVVAIDSDVLYPPMEQQELATYIPNAELVCISSRHGHDAFLIEMDVLNSHIMQFRQTLTTQNKAISSTR